CPERAQATEGRVWLASLFRWSLTPDHWPLFIIISSKETPLPFDDLRQWIAALDRAGELKRIKTEADPILEIAEITDRVSKSKIGGPALLFQNLKGYP